MKEFGQRRDFFGISRCEKIIIKREEKVLYREGKKEKWMKE